MHMYPSQSMSVGADWGWNLV